MESTSSDQKATSCLVRDYRGSSAQENLLQKSEGYWLKCLYKRLFLYHCCKMGFPLQDNPKNLDLSY